MGRVPKTHRKQRKKLAAAARLWASGQLTTSHDDDAETTERDTAAAGFGLEVVEADEAPSPEPEPHDIYYLWPENVQLWCLWPSLQTLWRKGMAGPEGFDYPGLFVYLREVAGIKPRKFRAAVACLQAMEAATLDEWAKARAATAP